MRPGIAVVIIAAALAFPPGTVAEDATSEAFQQAQSLKRSGRFAEARVAFQEIAGHGDPKWSGLAADEVRYGLPLHEANVLLARQPATGDHPARAAALNRVDALYQTMLAENADRPERIGEIERRRDQLALLRQSARGAEHTSVMDAMRQLGQRIEQHYSQSGRWPDRRQIELQVADLLRAAGLAPDRLSLFDFYPSSTSFYATLRDQHGGPDIKIKGDANGVNVEGGKP